MREPREIRRDPDERRTESPRAGPGDRGDLGDARTVSTRDEKTWTDAEGNRRHDVTYDNKDAKKGEISHRETHEVTYNKGSADGKHKAGDQESSTWETIKH